MNLKLFTLLLSLSSCQGKLRLLADGSLERCDPKSKKEVVVDIDIEFLVENDEAFLNGNGSFNDDVKVFKLNFWTEKKTGSSWYRAPIQMSNIDLCRSIIDKKEFLYSFMKEFPPCPVKKGDVWTVDMKKFEFDDFEVPDKLEGEYTLYVELQSNKNGVVKKDCWKKRGEISHF